MRITRSIVLASLGLASLGTLAACGGSKSSNPDSRVISTVDGGADGSTTPDGADAVCTVSSASFGDKGALTGQYIFTPGTDTVAATDDVLEADALLETGQPSDGVSVILYAGYGAFSAGAITAGTYQITGDELDFATCGVCVIIGTNFTSTGHDDDYMATGGTVTLTSVGTKVGDTLAGSISNVQFHHATIDPQTGATTIAADTCTTSITNATFSGALTAAP